MTELWATIQEFDTYQVSREGIVRRFHPVPRILKPYPLPDGSMGVKLFGGGRQHQLLVRRLVAESFCDRPTENSDTVIHKDHNKENCNASNLAWRPRWFAWKYFRQTSEPILHDWTVRPIRNRVTNVLFENVVEAGVYDGTLWFDVHRSAMQRTWAFPFMQYEFMDFTWTEIERAELGL